MHQKSNGVHQACAACKHQRKKCSEKCVLAPFFPSEKSLQFQAVHKIFGVSNISKILTSLKTYEEREEAIRTLVWEAECRQKDPVSGCYGEYQRVYDELIRLRNQQVTIPTFHDSVMYKSIGWNNNDGTGTGVEINFSNPNFVDNNGNFKLLESLPYNYVQAQENGTQGRDAVLACPANTNTISSLGQVPYFIPEKCDMFTVKWIFDNASYPLYNESDCPYIFVQLACWKHGRIDLEYWNWRWEPHDYNPKSACPGKRHWTAFQLCFDKFRRNMEGDHIKDISDEEHEEKMKQTIELLTSLKYLESRFMNNIFYASILSAEVYKEKDLCKKCMNSGSRRCQNPIADDVIAVGISVLGARVVCNIVGVLEINDREDGDGAQADGFRGKYGNAGSWRRWVEELMERTYVMRSSSRALRNIRLIHIKKRIVNGCECHQNIEELRRISQEAETCAQEIERCAQEAVRFALEAERCAKEAGRDDQDVVAQEVARLIEQFGFNRPMGGYGKSLVIGGTVSMDIVAVQVAIEEKQLKEFLLGLHLILCQSINPFMVAKVYTNVEENPIIRNIVHHKKKEKYGGTSQDMANDTNGVISRKMDTPSRL
ncbi:hypothetical protein IFM89_007852 [Coptis chinensis]|uniref:LOB domain-containing protein n=1 Tax=Coptis chinensis TaxID=261450 RepID=A0A835GZU8_9MAGN|nr:hypothetical protein IFM89_007852 [Coptis chinensis]